MFQINDYVRVGDDAPDYYSLEELSIHEPVGRVTAIEKRQYEVAFYSGMYGEIRLGYFGDELDPVSGRIYNDPERYTTDLFTYAGIDMEDT